MAVRGWGSLFSLLGAVLAVNTFGTGCQRQLTYSVLSGGPCTNGLNQVAGSASPAAGGPVTPDVQRDIVRTSHPQAPRKLSAGKPPEDLDALTIAKEAFQAADESVSRLSPEPPPETPLPRELVKASLLPYIIEPPDILLIDAIRIVPLLPYRIEPMDVLLIQVAETFPNQPISGTYPVSPEGIVNLGFSYGAVRVAGLTLEQAATAVKDQLGPMLQNPQVGLALAQFRGLEQVRGEHLVGMDGTISLGSYGGVYVTGLTIPQAKCAIEKYLSQYLLNPEIALGIAGYNSKVYYVITDGAGFGEQVFRFPITGNETVLDALSNINGIPAAGSKRHIWLARPAPVGKGYYRILPVDWEVITQGGSTETDYQILPGDRIYVKADRLIWLDNVLAKILSPVERLFGVPLLGNCTVRSFEQNRNNTTPALR